MDTDQYSTLDKDGRVKYKKISKASNVMETWSHMTTEQFRNAAAKILRRHLADFARADEEVPVFFVSEYNKHVEYMMKIWSSHSSQKGNLKALMIDAIVRESASYVTGSFELTQETRDKIPLVLTGMVIASATADGLPVLKGVEHGAASVGQHAPATTANPGGIYPGGRGNPGPPKGPAQTVGRWSPEETLDKPFIKQLTGKIYASKPCQKHMKDNNICPFYNGCGPTGTCRTTTPCSAIHKCGKPTCAEPHCGGTHHVRIA
jgi:hypothetical protein